MYDLPELRSANDILWQAIAGHLRNGGLSGVPDALKRAESGDLDGLWRSPDLLLGQTCGYPLMTRLKGAVRVVALPHFGFSGCTGPLHRSVLIVPRASDAGSLADLRSTRCAVNGFDSNSGMNLLRAAVAPIAAGRPFFSAVLVTGAHVASLEAVAAGGADLAAIDCVTYGHLTRWRPDLVARTRTLGLTAPSPTLPLITARRSGRRTLRALRQALVAVATDPALAPIRRTLGLTGFSMPKPGIYRQVTALERAAEAWGYPRLA